MDKWNRFKQQLNEAYAYAHETEVNELREYGGSLDTLYYLRRAFENQSYKIPCNTKHYRGQRGWFGKIPERGDSDTLGSFISTSHDVKVAKEFAEGGNPPVYMS